MPVFVVRNEQDKRQVMANIDSREKDFTVTIRNGIDRSKAQHRLQWQWYQDAEAQGDMTAQEYRGFCKLHFGIGILKAADETFAIEYDRLVKWRPYEEKLLMMMEPFNFQVTSLMKVPEMRQYLDAVWNHFHSIGIQLTDPDKYGLADLMRRVA